MSKKQRMGYIISIDGNDDFEFNVDDEILVFDTLEQIKKYCATNKIDIDKVNVYSIELEA
nr:MAG TPA_asm: Papain-like proteinase [Caudoviricetes sp.]